MIAGVTHAQMIADGRDWIDPVGAPGTAHMSVEITNDAARSNGMTTAANQPHFSARSQM